MVRCGSVLATLIAASFSNVTPALAHFGLADGEDIGSELFWVWGIFIAGILGFFVYQRFCASDETPAGKALKIRISDLERALNSCQSQLQNAADYPNECGLTDRHRQERLESAASLQGLIEESKIELATI